ncbi:MAG: right-handed parallel beta-helix repeat-containing protein [bacterium]
MKKWLIGLAGISAFLVLPISAFAQTASVTVKRVGGCAGAAGCYESLQQAINVVDPGGTVSVQDNVSVDSTVIIGKRLTLSGGSGFRVEAAPAFPASSPLIIIDTTNDVKISTITISKGSGPAVSAIVSTTAINNLQITGSTFENFTGAAISLDNVGSTDTAKQIKITSNIFTSNGKAVEILGDSHNISIASNTINASLTTSGIEVTGGAYKVEVKSNIIDSAGTGILLGSSAGIFPAELWNQNIAESNNVGRCTVGIAVTGNEVAAIRSNTVSEGTTGISIGGSAQPTISGSSSITRNETGIDVSAPNIVLSGITISDNTVGVLSSGGGLLVTASNISDNADIGINITGGANNKIIANTNITNNRNINISIAGDTIVEKNAVGGGNTTTSINITGGANTIISNGISARGTGIKVSAGTNIISLNKISQVSGECLDLQGGVSTIGGYGATNEFSVCDYGVRVRGGDISGEFSYNLLDRNRTALQIESGGFTYAHNYINSNDAGVVVTNTGSAIFTANQVSSSTNTAVSIDGASATVSDNIINNNRYGLDIRNAGSRTVERNNIYSNTGEGIIVGGGASAAINFNFLFNNNTADNFDEITDNGVGSRDSNYFKSEADYDVNPAFGDGLADAATVVIPGSASNDNAPLLTSAKVDAGLMPGTLQQGSIIPIQIPAYSQPRPIGSTRKAYLWYSYSTDSGVTWTDFQKYSGSYDIDTAVVSSLPGVAFTAPITVPTPGNTLIYRFFYQGSDDTLTNKEVVPPKTTYEAEAPFNGTPATSTPSFTPTPSNTVTPIKTATPVATATPVGTYYSPTPSMTPTPSPTSASGGFAGWQASVTATPIGAFITAPGGAPQPPVGSGSGGGGGGGGGNSNGSTPVPTSANGTPVPTATYDLGKDTLPDNSKIPQNFYALNFKSQWVNQYKASDYEGAANDGDEYFDVPACTVVDFWADLKNSGNSPWVSSANTKATANNEFTFATYKDPKVKSAPSWLGYDNCPLGNACGKSYFKHSSWVTDYRIGTLAQDVVYPGETGRVNMKFQVPCDAEKGRYREDISAASGKYWIYNDFNGDPLKVMHIWVGFDVK